MNNQAASNPAGVPILGQPFTLAHLTLPVNGLLTCNCVVPGVPLHILASAPVTCPGCQKTYLVAFNPQNGQLTVAMGTAVENPGS
jgi:hypothetical protein